MIFKKKYKEKDIADLFGPVRSFTFFDQLQEFIINQPRVLARKGTFVERYRERFGLFKLGVPYWEIHFFQEGFTHITGNQQIDKNALKQRHFYFTFRSLLEYEAQQFSAENVEEANLFTLYQDVKVTRSYNKIDNKYTGKPADQSDYGINLYVFRDTPRSDGYYDNATAQSLNGSPFEMIAKCINDEILLRDLPQVMFLSEGSKFNAQVKDPGDSIVAIDMFSSVNGIGSGGLYVHQGSVLYPLLSSVSYSGLGRNILIGRNCEISSSYIGNNVMILNRVVTERGSKIRDCALIGDRVRLIEEQEILAGQKIISTPPLMLNGIGKHRNQTYQSFLESSEEMKKKKDIDELYDLF